jgi:histidyl-tRNA synthetase
MAEQINAVKGMNDILPESSYIWLWLEDKFQQLLHSYGYNQIRTPIVEHTALFSRAIGQATDIVEKEMYSFVDKLNNDGLTLRPEGTASVIRAVLEHHLLYNNTQKLWYMGQMFRHEKPQKGRYRQFYQLGVEALGFKCADIDTEIILIQHDLWQVLGIKNVELQINCLGELTERNVFRNNLIQYLEKYKNDLDDDAQRRLYTNPLRILDSKNARIQEIPNEAPKLIDYLSSESIDHYNQWKEKMTNLGVKYRENVKLVRGLDYYNLSVFEWVSTNPDAQTTLSGGGRYDPLIGQLGGKDGYAIGFALGVERVILELINNKLLPKKPTIDIFIASFGNNCATYSLQVANLLRNNGYSVYQNFTINSLKSQLRYAQHLQVKVSLIIGENELHSNQVMVKYMETQIQNLVQLNDLVAHITQLIK